MTDPYLSVASDGGTMQSNEIASAGVGVEVKAGITGLGLPPVELQFDQAVGDGARYRGQRVLQRSLDLRFHVYGPTRASLKSTLDRISMILAHQVTVTFHDPEADEEWVIRGYRSGGGDYAYGDTSDAEEGSDGKSWCNLMVTLVTETPYWESTTTITETIGAAGTLALSNPGTKDSAPVWTVKGPTLGFSAVSEAGEVLSIPGYIDKETELTIDCALGTVVDSNGVNRYNELGALPRFWNVPVGDSDATVVLDQTSTAYQADYSAGRKNYVLNPNFRTSAMTWTLAGFTYDGTNDRLNQDSTNPTSRPKISSTVGGLTPGENYVVIVMGSIPEKSFGSTTTPKFSRIRVLDGDVVKYRDINTALAAGTEYAFEFTAENASVVVEFLPFCGLRKDKTYARSAGYVSEVFLGEPGRYFDGDTPDSLLMDHSWSGAAGNSISTAVPLIAIPPATGAEVTVSYRPRKWLVI